MEHYNTQHKPIALMGLKRGVKGELKEVESEGDTGAKKTKGSSQWKQSKESEKANKTKMSFFAPNYASEFG